MKVFLSWSGNKSHRVAMVFRDWLPSVIQSVIPYVSSEDIDKGARWSSDIAKELEDSTFGILCVTKENINAPWLTFEAGALSKTMDKSFVSPFLFDIKRSEVEGPILQFQSTILQKEDIKKLVNTINNACSENQLSEDRLEKAFNVWYPNLESELNKVKQECGEIKTTVPEQSVENSNSEILEEVLELARINQKLLRNPEGIYNETVGKINENLENISRKIIRLSDANEKKFFRKIHPMMIEDIIACDDFSKNDYIGFQIVLSIFKEDFPWIYDAGREVITILKNNLNKETKYLKIKEFDRIVSLTFDNPLIRDFLMMSKNENKLFYRDASRILFRYLERLGDFE